MRKTFQILGIATLLSSSNLVQATPQYPLDNSNSSYQMDSSTSQDGQDTVKKTTRTSIRNGIKRVTTTEERTNGTNRSVTTNTTTENIGSNDAGKSDDSICNGCKELKKHCKKCKKHNGCKTKCECNKFYTKEDRDSNDSEDSTNGPMAPNPMMESNQQGTVVQERDNVNQDQGKCQENAARRAQLARVIRGIRQGLMAEKTRDQEASNTIEQVGKDINQNIGRINRDINQEMVRSMNAVNESINLGAGMFWPF